MANDERKPAEKKEDLSSQEKVEIWRNHNAARVLSLEVYENHVGDGCDLGWNYHAGGQTLVAKALFGSGKIDERKKGIKPIQYHGNVDDIFDVSTIFVLKILMSFKHVVARGD